MQRACGLGVPGSSSSEKSKSRLEVAGFLPPALGFLASPPVGLMPLRVPMGPRPSMAGAAQARRLPALSVELEWGVISQLAERRCSNLNAPGASA